MMRQHLGVITEKELNLDGDFVTLTTASSRQVRVNFILKVIKNKFFCVKMYETYWKQSDDTKKVLYLKTRRQRVYQQDNRSARTKLQGDDKQTQVGSDLSSVDKQRRSKQARLFCQQVYKPNNSGLLISIILSAGL